MIVMTLFHNLPDTKCYVASKFCDQDEIIWKIKYVPYTYEDCCCKTLAKLAEILVKNQIRKSCNKAFWRDI